MMTFRRRSAPDFWAEKERSYLIKGDVTAKTALHGWQHRKCSLAEWFHAEVRSRGEPPLCAYCDGPLAETSAATIDHFVPWHVIRELGLSWPNLYPTCSFCNTTCKGTKWSCRLLRPDVDLLPPTPGDADLDGFLRWFHFDPLSGRLSPAGDDPVMRARVRLTLGVFRLNAPIRCNARRDRWRDLMNAAKHPIDHGRLEEMASLGPYRFVARLFLAQRRAGATS